MSDRVVIRVTDNTGFDGLELAFDEVMMPVIIAMTEKVTGDAQAKAPSYRGAFRSSIQPVSEKVGPMVIQGLVVSTSPYAAIIEGVDDAGNEVEFGRRPGAKFPDIGELRLWVERVISPPEEKIDEVIFLVGRKIVSKGIPAKRPIGEAFRQNESLINREIDTAIDAIYR